MQSSTGDHSSGFGKEVEFHVVCGGEEDDSSSGKVLKEGNGYGKGEVQGSVGEEESSKRASSCFSATHLYTSQHVNSHENSPVMSASTTEATSAKPGHENLKELRSNSVNEGGYAYSKPTEHSQSACGRLKGLLEGGAFYSTSEACTIENAPPYHVMNNVAGHHVLRGYIHESLSGYVAAGQQANNLAAGQRPGTYVRGAVPLNGGYAYGSMIADGELGRYGDNNNFEHGENKANAYAHATIHNDPRGTTHACMPKHNESSQDEESMVTINQTVISIGAPSLINGSVKADSLLATSSYSIVRSGYLKSLSLILRFGGAMFSLLAFSVMISTTESRVAAGSTFYVRFSDYQAYNYLTAVNLLCFLYSSWQMIILTRPLRSSSVLSSPIKWEASMYICDQMLAFLMVSSSSSAATASELSLHGLHNIWPPACSTWKLSRFCSKADVAVVMSFFSSLSVLLSSFSSGYRISSLLAE